MTDTQKRLPLERLLFLCFAGVSTLLLLLMMGITLYWDVERENRAIDDSIRHTAAYVAGLDGVVDMLARGYPDAGVKRTLDALAESFPDLDVIAVYDRAGMRFYHTDRETTGETFVRGDETAILSGSAPYITTGYGTYGIQRRAFHAVTDSGGEIIGFVMTSIFQSGILERRRDLIVSCLLILAGISVLGLLLSRLTVRLITRSLRGHHPSELLNLYLQQDDVLNCVEEGLVATDERGVVIFSNRVARRLFTGSEEPLQSRALSEVFPDSRCTRVLRAGQATHNRACMIGNRQVLVSELPFRGEREHQGTLSVFQDRTEMMRLSDELSGTQYMLETLRLFNHEFMNKLHIVLGYIQTGESAKAVEFIMNSGLVSGQAIRETADAIRVPRLCALVIGKMMHAAESGIVLTVTPDSTCWGEDLLIPVEDCGTILGNLMENAIEELGRTQSETREIRLGVHCRPDCNLFICEDTGGGIAPEVLPTLFHKGASSKGTGRGLGLYLVDELVTRNGGAIDVETEAGAGTCFTVTFTRQEGEDVPGCDR